MIEISPQSEYKNINYNKCIPIPVHPDSGSNIYILFLNYHYFFIAARAVSETMSATMSAEEFLANVEGGIVPVTCHEDVLRIVFIYLDEGLWNGNGVFDVVEKLHAHSWSFGEGELRFNR